MRLCWSLLPAWRVSYTTQRKSQLNIQFVDSNDDSTLVIYWSGLVWTQKFSIPSNGTNNTPVNHLVTGFPKTYTFSWTVMSSVQDTASCWLFQLLHEIVEMIFEMINSIFLSFQRKTVVLDRKTNPRSWLPWSAALLLLCLPLGIPAIVLSLLVSTDIKKGDYTAAKRKSEATLVLNIIGTILGGLVLVAAVNKALFTVGLMSCDWLNCQLIECVHTWYQWSQEVEPVTHCFESSNKAWSRAAIR